MPTTVDILGSCAAWPEAGRACSGLLVTSDSFRLVVDLGYGTLPRLLALIDGDADLVDAVVVTHAHPDHVVDLHGLYRARRWSGALPSRRLPLLAPDQVLETLSRIDPEDADGPAELFGWTPLPATTDIGPWRLTSLKTPHYVENVAVRLDGVDGSLVVTGDSGPYAPLEEFSRGCDLLICYHHPAQPIELSARQYPHLRVVTTLNNEVIGQCAWTAV